MSVSVHVGVHMLITLKNIPEHVKLERVDTVKPLMQKIINACDLHVVAEAGHQFEPFGATYVYVLEESHFSIHTYPEKYAAYMDIFCCNLAFDCDKAIASIKEAFNTNTVDCEVMYR